MERIAVGLAQRGIKVDVVTYDDSMVGLEESSEGFWVHRVTNPVRTSVNIVIGALTLNTELGRVAANIIHETPDESKLVHAVEWLCVPAAVQLKKTLGVPYVLSLHSVESERSFGGTLSPSITYFEKLGCSEASRVIVGKRARAESLERLYGVPGEAVVVIDSSNDELDRLIAQYEASITASQTALHRVAK